jgi:phytoene synthase
MPPVSFAPDRAAAEPAAFRQTRRERATPADMAACRALLGAGSRTFLAASRLLPPRVRDPAISLYAFCRVADDAIDQGDDPDLALVGLHARLRAACADRPHDAAPDRALADVIARFAIPEALPAALLDGFAWDAGRRRYADLAALTGYAVRVAGSVGMMMALLMGVRSAETVARACELGVAMQFSNIARDVGEDARAGRIYLPLDWLAEQGIDPEAWLAEPVFSPGIAACVARLLVEAEALYRRAGAGIAALPPACRPGIRAASRLYREIGREVARHNHDSVSGRAVVPAWRKLVGLARAVAPAAAPPAAAPPGQPLAALPQAAFLLATLESAPALAPAAGLEHRVAWLVDLFARLGARDRLPGLSC